LNGFDSLEAVSSERTKPFSQNRQGINIGEGAALFIVSKENIFNHKNCLKILGLGESSDAYHISSPHPAGVGAIKAMKSALANAKLEAGDIDYINLHGTGTIKNDSMESLAVHSVFPNLPYVSSTKPMTGHTLGAAGAIELAFICLVLLSDQTKLPIHHWDEDFDPDLKPLNYVKESDNKMVSFCMSNSYAFGGNNVSVIVGRNHE